MQRSGFDAWLLAAICGLSLLLTSNWSGDIVGGISGFGSPDANALSRLGECVAFFALALGHRRAGRLASANASGCVVAVAAVALARIAVSAGASPGWTLLMPLVDALFGAANACVLLLWLSLIARLAPRQSGVALPAAYLLTGFSYFVLRTLDAHLVLALLCVLPVASAALAARLAPRAAGAEADGERGADPDGAPSLAAGGWSFPVVPVTLMFAYKLVFHFSLSLTRGPSMYGLLGIVCICSFALIGEALFFERFRAGALQRLALPLMVAGLLVLGWLDPGSREATLLTNAANISFELFIVIALCEVCFRFGISPWWLLGIVQGVASLAACAGFAFGGRFVEWAGLGSEPARLAVFASVVLISASVFFLSDRSVSRAFGMGLAQAPRGDAGSGKGEGPARIVGMTYYEELVWRCERVARRFGLSRREEEILELLAQGMSASRIEEELVISRNTVKTHTRHIYEKLGVHSRDEARRIVEAEGAAS